MSSIFFQSVSIQVWVLIAFVIVLLGAIGVLIWVVISVRNVLYPKFGFGGKPLTTFAIILLLITLPLAVFAVKQRIDVIKKAAMMNDVSVIWFEVADRGEVSDVAFSVTPIVNGVAWADKTFNIEWQITGPQNVTFKEEQRSSLYPSYFVIALKKGTYEVTVRVTSEKIDMSEIVTVTID